MKPYSVLLLYPDHATDYPGVDTYFSWTMAKNPHQAAANVQLLAERDNTIDKDEPSYLGITIRADEFRVLAVFAGHIDMELGGADFEPSSEKGV